MIIHSMVNANVSLESPQKYTVLCIHGELNLITMNGKKKNEQHPETRTVYRSIADQ